MNKSQEKSKTENNIFLTIFTPTYNRYKTLDRLYESLKNQTDNDFEWIVVDDGSTDDTEKYFEKIKKENKIKIKYMKKENEGKHIAINYGAKLAQGKMFFIVDSDDALDKDAVKIIKKYESHINDSEYAGVAGLKTTFDYKIIKSVGEYYDDNEFTQESIDATSAEYRYKLNIKGDRAEVVYTKHIKLFPFPKINNDKFMEESYLWDNLSILNLKFRWINEKIYLVEYMNNGLSNNMNNLLKKNWASHVYCSNLSLSIKNIPLKNKLRFCVRYYRYGIYGKIKIKELFIKSNNKLLSIIAIPISLIKKVR